MAKPTKTQQRATTFNACVVWQGIFTRYYERHKCELRSCEAGLANGHVARYTEYHMDHSMDTFSVRLEEAKALGLA